MPGTGLETTDRVGSCSVSDGGLRAARESERAVGTGHERDSPVDGRNPADNDPARADRSTHDCHDDKFDDHHDDKLDDHIDDHDDRGDHTATADNHDPAAATHDGSDHVPT